VFFHRAVIFSLVHVLPPRALVFSLPIQLPWLEYLLVTSTQRNCGISSRELVHANFPSMDLNIDLEEEENNNYCGIDLNIPQTLAGQAPE
jgi:hypothetical protein